MNTIKAFFARITQCSIDPSSYRLVRAKGLGSAYGYLYCLLVLTWYVSVLWISAMIVNVMPTVKRVALDMEQTIPTLYPDKLILTVESGSLSTNVREPYIIKMPEHWASFVRGLAMELPTNLVVIDTNAAAEDYEALDTAFLLTEKYGVVKDKDNGQLRMFPYGEYGDAKTVVEKRDVVNLFNLGVREMKKAYPTIKTFSIVALAVSPFTLATFSLLWWMFILLIGSLLLYFASSMAKWNYTYGEIYKLSVYGATPVIILGMLLWIVGTPLPWLLPAFFLVWMWVVLKKLR